MQIQNIQSNNINSNSFKAVLKNDKNGYLLKLWNDAEKGIGFNNELDCFMKNNTNDVFEITDFNKRKYTIVNHTNGTIYKFPYHKSAAKVALQNLLFMLNYKLTQFKKLTGESINSIIK